MEVTTSLDVKVYNLSAGKSLPEWVSERKRRKLLKDDPGLRQRIELLQDFSMPTASSRMQTSADGQYILATGTYKPRVRCYDVNQLSMKFERCFDAEAIQFCILSEDYSKVVFLQNDRHVEFHSQSGHYYRMRMPKFGRDMSYHPASCDLYVVGVSNDIYRLNLDQGRFLNSLSSDMSAINVCQFNTQLHLFAAGSEKGQVECWDPRSRARVGNLDVALSVLQHMSDLGHSDIPSITALKFLDSLNLAFGVSTGQVLLFDIRANKPYHIQDHHYNLPINTISFQDDQDLVLSSDSKILKIWERNTGKLFTSVEPIASINEVCHVAQSGLVLLASESPKMQVYYIPALGPAPRWCSFLDSLTEELEENPEPSVYEDYKFVTLKDLESLGLSHLVGTNLLRAYMHGYFMDIKLYNKAKSIVTPFAFEEYKRNKIKEKLDSERTTRVNKKQLPKVNRDLAVKLIESAPSQNMKGTVSNPLGDERFSAIFSNPDFTIDQESEEYKLLHPVLSKHEKKKKKAALLKHFEEIEESEPEGQPSDMEDDFDSSSDDDKEMWSQFREEKRQARTLSNSSGPKMYEIKKGIDFHSINKPQDSTQDRRLTLGKLVENEAESVAEGTSTAFGNKTVSFKLKKTDKVDTQQERVKTHQKERREVGRSAKSLLSKRKGPVYWRGKRIK